MVRTLDSCSKDVRPVKRGRVDLIEVNYLAAMAGTTWQEALEFVQRSFRKK